MHDDMNMMNRPDNHEAKMARADLFKLAQYSFKLFKMINEDQELEGWVQAKVTKAADYIASVYHYMEYEMKISEYGDAIENADMYSESIRRAFSQKLTEAKEQAKKAKAKVKKAEEELDEGWDDMIKASKEREKEKGTGKFDSKKTSTGTVYTRKSSTFDDGGDDSDTKKAKKAGKVKEAMAPTDVDGATAPPPKGPDGQYPMVTSGPNKGKRWSPQTPGPTNPALGATKTKRHPVMPSRTYEVPVKEGSKPDFLDMDKDGNKKEPMKKAVADKKKNPFAKVKEAAAKCNHTAKGEKCPVHGLKECGSMYEGSTGDYSAKKAAAGKDIGKPGKNFAKIAKSAEKGGAKSGEAVAGAVLKKLRAKG